MSGNKKSERSRADLESTRLMLGQKLGDLLSKKVASIEWNGHFLRGTDIFAYSLAKYLQGFFISLPNPEVWVLDRILRNPKRGPRTHYHQLGKGLLTCDQCDMRLNFDTNGLVYRVTNPCPFPDGIEPVTVEVNIPSGKMVVGSDFRTVFGIAGMYPKSNHGRYKSTIKYAEVGAAHFYVGNTNPCLFKLSPKIFLVGVEGYYKKEPPVTGAENVAKIDTNDLWWCTIVDYDEYRHRTKLTGKEQIIECDPGVYQFTHNLKSEYTTPRTLTRIGWVRGKAAEQPDWRKTDFTAGQVIDSHIKMHSLLERHQDEKIAAVVQLLFGDDNKLYKVYHPAGWTSLYPDIGSSSVQIPSFSKPYRWILNGNSILAKISGLSDDGNEVSHLNDSFLSLAMNMCHCIIMNGVIDSDSKRANETIQWATRCFAVLCSKNQSRIPKEYMEVYSLVKNK